MSKIIGKGAEATITLLGNKVLKKREPKHYRIKEIDDKLRKTRTRKEAKLLGKLEGIGPALISTDNESSIEMEYIEGQLLRDTLTLRPKLAKKIGKQTGNLHNQNIIHGDLTTSNMILDKHNDLRFIDFGLSFQSHKTEDKAVDLHLFLEAVESKHFQSKDRIWNEFVAGYNPVNKKEILKRLEVVEKRGRNKQKY